MVLFIYSIDLFSWCSRYLPANPSELSIFDKTLQHPMLLLLLYCKQLLKIFSMYTLYTDATPPKTIQKPSLRSSYGLEYLCCFAAQLNITNIGKYGKRSFSGFHFLIMYIHILQPLFALYDGWGLANPWSCKEIFVNILKLRENQKKQNYLFWHAHQA